MFRRSFLKVIPALGISRHLNFFNIADNRVLEAPKNADSRGYWVSTLTRIADPLLKNLSQEKLKVNLAFEGKVSNRQPLTYLEGFGRLLSGIAPWLELGPDMGTEEGRLREKYIKLTRDCIKVAVNPSSPDYMFFEKPTSSQPLVDSAFLAQGLIRGYTQLWEPLSAEVKTNVLNALKLSRILKPGNNNWVLFSAMVEAFILKAENDCDFERINFALGKLNEWYKGDSIYGDGPNFHFDYYNSFVMHPMLLDIAKIMLEKGKITTDAYTQLLKRSKRYAAIQERTISPEGTFPVIGRSLAYRFGVFHLLGQVTLMRELPEDIKPAQVRSALSAVIHRMIEAPGTFDKNGWLRVGFCGHQPNIGEDYISTGSLYLCTVGLLPLGLPASDPFWSAPAADWTSKKAWSGVDLANDHAIGD